MIIANAINFNDTENIYLYYVYCILSGASIGIYGTNTYIIIINKCEGILEIIGLS